MTLMFSEVRAEVLPWEIIYLYVYAGRQYTQLGNVY